VHAPETYGALAEPRHHARGRDTTHALPITYSWGEQLSMHLPALSLREPNKLMHNDIELQRLPRRFRAARLQAQAQNTDYAQRIRAEDLKRKVLHSALKHRRQGYLSVANATVLRHARVLERVLEPEMLHVFWPIHVRRHLAHRLHPHVQLLKAP